MTIADETPDAPEPDAPAPEAEAEAVAPTPDPEPVPEAELPELPEPTLVGHGVVQDNVSGPDQVTSLPDGTETGRHTPEDADTPPAPIGQPEADEDDAEAPA